MADPIERIIAFLREIGIPVEAAPVGDAFLPGIEVRNGGLIYDPALPYPGDLLHEAGHIAVTDPALRPTLCAVASDPAEEMAAIAWSYAAARAAGIDPALVFHEHGYRGGGGYLIPAMEQPSAPGAPMLAYYGMTSLAGDSAFPAMSRWLR